MNKLSEREHEHYSQYAATHSHLLGFKIEGSKSSGIYWGHSELDLLNAPKAVMKYYSQHIHTMKFDLLIPKISDDHEPGKGLSFGYWFNLMVN